MEYPFSHPELLRSSGSRCNFLFRTEARPKILTSPSSSSSMSQLWHSPSVPKRPTPAPCSANVSPSRTSSGVWERGNGLGRRGGQCQGSALFPAKPCRSLSMGKTHFKMSQSHTGDTQFPLKNIQQLLCKPSGENLPGNSDLAAATFALDRILLEFNFYLMSHF